MAGELSDFETFWFGCLGGLAGYLLVFALPELRRGWDGADVALTAGRLALALSIAAVYSALGGVTALTIGGAVEAKHAIAYGLAFEPFLGGIMKGATSARASQRITEAEPTSHESLDQ